MVLSIVLSGAALRVGLVLRRSRRFRSPRPRDARRTHLRLAKPAVAAVLLGFAAGPVSAVALRDWQPFHSFHAWLGITAAALFIAAAVVGRRIERGRSRDFDVHALLGLLAMLAAVVAGVAGFAIMP